MEKYQMREWVATVEEIVDNKLKKWKKGPKIENGEAVHMNWQFEQTHLLIDAFWEDHKEAVHLHFTGPRESQRFEWHGLNTITLNKIQDRVGNLAIRAMYPIQDSIDE